MDTAALLLADRVANNIQLGESHIREFKSAFEGPPGAKKPRAAKEICGEIGEQLVGFANADVEIC
jgi:ATP-dependent DNA helicase RecG